MSSRERTTELNDISLARLKNLGVDSFLAFCGVALYTCASLIDVSELASFSYTHTVVDLLKASSMSLLIAKAILFTDNYTYKDLLIVFLLTIWAFLELFIAGSAVLLNLVFFYICLHHIDFNVICISIYYSVLVTTIAVILLAYSGFINNIEFLDKSILSDRLIVRRQLGFNHQNCLGYTVLTLNLTRMYIRKDRYNAIDYMLQIASAAFLFFYVGTRTASILIIVSCVLSLYSSVNADSIFKYLVYLSVIFVAVGTVFPFIYDYSNPIHQTLNRMTSGRLLWARQFIERYPIVVFGQRLELVSTRTAALTGLPTQILDNAYIKLILMNGILSFIVIMVIYFSSMQACIKNRDIVPCILIVTMLLCGISENWMFTFPWCFPMMFGAASQKDYKDLGDKRKIEYI